MDTSSYHPADQIMQTPSDPVPEPTSADVEVQDMGNLAESIKMVSSEDQKTLLAVFQFLKKKNLASTVEVLQKETEKAGGNSCASYKIFLMYLQYALLNADCTMILISFLNYEFHKYELKLM